MSHNQGASAPSKGMRSMSRFYLLTAILAVLLALATVDPCRADGKEFYIDETTDFSGNGCENEDVNEVTSSLQTSLVNNGWTGQRFTNANAWPQDFIERTFVGMSGLDSTFGDTRTLAVYAGHGNRALIQFGFMRKNRCVVTLDTDARLGTLAGDHAAYAMYVTSCTVNTDSLARHFNNQVRQVFGYHNSPTVKDDQPRDFFEATDNLDNVHAWLTEMEDKVGWWTGDNSPIAMTFGVTPFHCGAIRDFARLRGGTFLSDAPEPHANFCAILIDHGMSGC